MKRPQRNTLYTVVEDGPVAYTFGPEHTYELDVGDTVLVCGPVNETTLGSIVIVCGIRAWMPDEYIFHFCKPHV